MMVEKTRIVLMPGIDGTGIFFEPLIDVLPPDISVSVIKYPQDAILSLEEHARFVADYLPADYVIIVAESFSGLVALMLLHTKPRQIKGVVFSATFAEELHHTLIHGVSLIPGMESLVKKLPVPLINHFLFGPYGTKGMENLLVRGLPHINAKSLKHRANLVAAGYPFLDERFDIPCLYLQATQDRVVPQKAASWFAAHFHPFELARFDAPHCLLQTKPAECSVKIFDFIKHRIYLP